MTPAGQQIVLLLVPTDTSRRSVAARIIEASRTLVANAVGALPRYARRSKGHRRMG